MNVILELNCLLKSTGSSVIWFHLVLFCAE